MLVVCDTSPLRALQALGQVGLIESLYGRALLPPAVADELSRDAPGLGPFTLEDYAFLSVRRPADAQRVEHLLEELNAGEAEALALAVEVQADFVLIDEAPARRAAARLGLKTTGALALLVQAKERGLIARVAPLLDELDAKIRFRISAQLRRRILEETGEWA